MNTKEGPSNICPNYCYKHQTLIKLMLKETSMETITNKFKLLFRPQPHSHHHAKHHGHGGEGHLPVYEQLSGDTNFGSESASPTRTSSSTEVTLRLDSPTTSGRPQTTRNREFSSSSETLASLGGSDIMAPHSSGSKFTFKLPPLNIFLSDFTLGFADGLTVPFALTAGLSSLGQTNTVIYAGMAEICAGSISMGIGGYLAAKGERREEEEDSDSDSRDDEENDNDENEKILPHKSEGSDAEESDLSAEKLTFTHHTHTRDDMAVLDDRLSQYLSPLHLPPYLQEQILSHARQSPYPLDPFPTSSTKQQQPTPETNQPPSPILSGFSIAIGYLLGGILPLFPYFFVSNVTDGLAWSFAVCVVALFTFGFGKSFLLSHHNNQQSSRGGKRARSAKWKRVKNSLWEGIQMVVLGSVAAIAAVVCVRAFEGFV